MNDGVSVDWVALATHANSLNTHEQYALSTGEAVSSFGFSVGEAIGDDDASLAIHGTVFPMLTGFSDIVDGIRYGIGATRDGIFSAAESWKKTEQHIAESLRTAEKPPSGA